MLMYTEQKIDTTADSSQKAPNLTDDYQDSLQFEMVLSFSDE